MCKCIKSIKKKKKHENNTSENRNEHNRSDYDVFIWIVIVCCESIYRLAIGKGAVRAGLRIRPLPDVLTSF